MAFGYYKQYEKAKNAGPEALHHYRESVSLRNLIKFSHEFITIENSGDVKVNFKGTTWSGISQLRAMEWLLDLRWGIKVRLSSIQPLKFIKEPGCGPILSDERKEEAKKRPSNGDPFFPIELSIAERRDLIAELEHELLYVDATDTKYGTLFAIKEKLIIAVCVDPSKRV